MELEKQITELAQNVASLKEGYDALGAQLAEDGDLKKMPAAMEQLEAGFESLKGDLDAKIAKVRRTAWDGDGRYRGAFANEDEARAFGAYVYSRAVGRGWGEDTERFGGKCAEILKRDYPDLHAKAMDSVDDGALIAPEFSSRLQRLVEQFGVFEADAMTMPMNSETLTFMRRTGGMSVFVVGENTAGTAGDPTYGNVTLTPKELGTLTYIPRTLDEDSLPQIGELVAAEISQAFAEASDDDGFNGDTSSTYHGFFGVIPKLKDINGVDDGGGLVLASGNAWSEIAQGDMDKLMGALPTYATNPAYYCSRPFFGQVLVGLMNAAGGATAVEIAGRKQLAFNGDPVRIVQKLPKTEANSQVPVVYGDLRMSSTVGVRRGITVETSRDYKFAERQLTILGTRRIAINNHDLGDATNAGPVVGLITASS